MLREEVHPMSNYSLNRHQEVQINCNLTEDQESLKQKYFLCWVLKDKEKNKIKDKDLSTWKRQLSGPQFACQTRMAS